MESGDIVRREVQTRVQNQFTEVLLFIPLLLYRKGTGFWSGFDSNQLHTHTPTRIWPAALNFTGRS